MTPTELMLKTLLENQSENSVRWEKNFEKIDVKIDKLKEDFQVNKADLSQRIQKIELRCAYEHKPVSTRSVSTAKKFWSALGIAFGAAVVYIVTKLGLG